MSRSWLVPVALVSLLTGCGESTSLQGDAGAPGGDGGGLMVTSPDGAVSSDVAPGADVSPDTAAAPDLRSLPDFAPAPDLLVGDGPAGSTPEAATSLIRAYCENGCGIHTALACPKVLPSCVAMCETSLGELITQQFPQCRAVLEALMVCGLARPMQDWACNADGEAEIKDGVCEAEGMAAAVCLLGA
jgi:hypothetical protein